MRKAKRAVLYARVSTDAQTTENQLRALRLRAEHAGWDIVGEYVDHAISGTKGRDKRPQFDRMLKAATRHEFDVIAAWSVDRLGRSLQHLVGFLAEIHASRIDLYLHQQGIDTTTPAGEAMFQMCGVFAQFERAMIVERINAGLARSRAKGTTLGRPRIDARVEAKIRKMAAGGMGKRKIARELGIGTGTAQRVLAARAH